MHGKILCNLDPKVKVKGKEAHICDGVPSTAALVFLDYNDYFELHLVYLERLLYNFSLTSEK